MQNPQRYFALGHLITILETRSGKESYQSESFIKVACVGMPTSCHLAIVLFSLDQVSRWDFSLRCQSVAFGQ